MLIIPWCSIHILNLSYLSQAWAAYPCWLCPFTICNTCFAAQFNSCVWLEKVALTHKQFLEVSNPGIAIKMHFAEPHGRTRICKLQQVILMFLISSGNSSYIKNNPCFAKIQTLIKKIYDCSKPFVNHNSFFIVDH